jgi:hypothetical protein
MMALFAIDYCLAVVDTIEGEFNSSKLIESL